MSEEWDFRAFTEQEHRARLAAAGAAMDRAGLVGCVCTSPELLYYFTGYEAHTHLAIGSQAMVLPANGHDPVLILRDGDLPQAAETLTVGTIHSFRLGAREMTDLVGEVIRDLGLPAGTLGLDISGPTMNGALTEAIRRALRDRAFEDCWRLLGNLRNLLSEAEIAYVREAATYADAGIDAFFGTARPGISEIELAAEIEYAMRSAGSDYPAIPTWMASGPRGWCQHAQASPRVLQSGDLVHAEFAGTARRYQCMGMGSLFLGTPSSRVRQMADGGKEALMAGLGAAHVGARIGDLEATYMACLAERGLGDCAIMRFGVGISAAYPPVWENQITIQLECDDLLEPGMAFYLHASMQDMDTRTGMLLGASYLMTAGGPERLDKAPLELVVING